LEEKMLGRETAAWAAVTTRAAVAARRRCLTESTESTEERVVVDFMAVEN
jgi:hypothetical protein